MSWFTTRRSLLANVSIVTLAAVLPARPQTTVLRGSMADPPSIFRGDPNARFSFIDTGGGIVLSRSKGQTPAFIHVSAANIAAIGTVLDDHGRAIRGATLRPYERLEYWWDFGDPTGTEIFTDPRTKVPVNANRQQYGPEAVYCYRTAGTKTITLHIRGLASGGGYVESRVQATFTVTEYDASGGSYYFDSVNGNDSNDGTSPSTPKQTLSAIQAKANIANVAIYLAYGSSWTSPTNIFWFSANPPIPRRISAYTNPLYPSSAKPQLIVNGSTEQHGAIVFWTHHGHVDTVLSQLDVRYGPLTTKGNPIHLLRTVNSGNIVQDIYIDNCDCTNTGSSGGGAASFYGATDPNNDLKTAYQRMSIWGGSYTATSPSTVSVIGYGSTMFMSYVGLTVTALGGGPGTIYGHIINPELQCNHVLFRWLNVSASAPGFNFIINLRCGEWNSKGVPDGIGGQVLFADNYLTNIPNPGGRFGNGIGNGNQRNREPKTRGQGYFGAGVVIERNSISGTSQSIFYITSATNWTARDNDIWSFGYHAWNPAWGHHHRGCFYRNRIYRDMSINNNNYPILKMFAFNDPCTQRQEITDNIIWDNRSGANAVIAQMNFADQLASGTTFARNRYYAPNMNNAPTGSYVWGFNPTSAKTLAQFQALSPNFDPPSRTTYGNPGWLDPAAGNFNT